MIRKAHAADHSAMVEIGAEVYANLGNYREILPSWLCHPGVEAYVAVGQGETIEGFIMVGIFDAPKPATGAVLDLLAIAVAPPFQRQGLGTALLHFAVQTAEADSRVLELRLTVAEDNAVAQRLFKSVGFEILDENHGAYDRGQRAIRMARHCVLQRPA
jgi:ribosomal protein S18 acetylase RimI-like enzyme